MNKLELIAVVAEKTGQSKVEVTRNVEAVLDAIVEVLAEGEEVIFTGFGTFEARKRSAREGCTQLVWCRLLSEGKPLSLL